MGLILGLIILSLTIAPQVSICPSSTANVMSMQFDQVNGYGIQARVDRFSLGYYNLTLSTRDQGELLNVGDGWVRQRELKLWEVNALAYRGKVVDVGIGINRIENGETGWQVYIEKNFSGIVAARLGFRRVEIHKPVDSISATFSVDVIEAVKTSNWLTETSFKQGGARGY